MIEIYLGKSTFGATYLTKHTWDCGWYWGMGYVGNINCHYHIKEMLKELDVSKAFTSTSITQNQWYVICDLFKQAYALKAVAGVYRYGSHITNLAGVTDCLKDSSKEAAINKDLEKLLDVTWDYIVNLKGE